MNIGKVKVSPFVLTEALGLPADWKIERIEYDSFSGSDISVFISGPDFPEHKEGESVKRCIVLVTLAVSEEMVRKKEYSFKVREVMR